MLTKRQKQILDYIAKYIKKNGYAPTLEEIGGRFKLSSISTVHQHVEALRSKGFLKKIENQPRSIELNKKRKVSDLVSIPLLGTIAAGEPIEAIEDKETIKVPKSQLSKSGEHYALRVSGDSMINDGVFDGDTVIIRKQPDAENGETVVALINGNEVTLKKIYKGKNGFRLQPANPSVKPIFTKELTIQGKVISVIRNFEELEELISPKITRKIKNIKKTINKGYEFYLGDCLKVLEILEQKYTTIYLDPPFNSNRNYKYSASEKSYAFQDTWEDGKYEQWLDSLIGLCKSKLKKDGTLFFHISAELSHIPEKVLKNHFKKVEPMFWKKAHGKNTVKNKLGSVIDVIYKASGNGSKFNLIYVPLNSQYFEKSYKNRDEVGYYALGSIKHDKTRRGYFYTIEKDGVVYRTPYGWKIPKSKLQQLMSQNRIHYAKPKNGNSKGMLYKKLYKHECKGKPLSNLWDDISYITRTTKDKRLYPTQKPLELLKRIIQLSSDKGDWVLDPVAGSGTTGAAAILLDRKVTLVDNNPKTASIIKKRMKGLAKNQTLF